MGNFSTILTAILCASAPLASVETREIRAEQTQSNFKLGKETISTIRAAYEKGEYDTFLQKMDGSYSQAVSEKGLDNLIEMRQKDVPVDFQNEMEAQFVALQKQRNEALLTTLSDDDSSIFAQKVRSLASNPSTPEQEKAISLLNNLISKAPNSGKNGDENKLIDIDMEYEFKLLGAAVPMDDISPQQRQEYQMALRMEKMDKMLEASKSFQDHALKQAVGLTAANFDERLARNLDGIEIHTYLKGKPANDAEEKVASIISSYQGQFNDLLKNAER